MSVKRNIPAAAAVMALLALAPRPGAGGEAPPYVLSLDGTTLAKFVMICDLIEGGQRATLRRREQLPHSYSFEAEALDCRITVLESHARLEAALTRGDRLIAWEETLASHPSLGLRSDGPWGSAAAWRARSGRLP